MQQFARPWVRGRQHRWLPGNTWTAWLEAKRRIRLWCTKSGVEAISGTKQFSTPPSVPAPALASMTESIASRDIADEEKFKEGLAKVIDGTVDGFTASIGTNAY